jgi:hypothetical protein
METNMRSLASAIGALAFCLVVSSVPARTASFSFNTAMDGGGTILMEGRIDQGDAGRLHALIDNARRSGRSLARVQLNSPGGNLGEGLKMATEIKGQRLATEVPKGATCASACFFVFAGGASKSVAADAKVGVHGAADLAGAETSSSEAATVLMARFAAQELKVPTGIIGKMVVTPPSSIIWLSREELQSLGAIETSEDFASSGVGAPRSSKRVANQAEASNIAWSEMMSDALALSSSAHNGAPDLRENCRPELKICQTALFFNRSNGIKAMLRSTRDAKGTVVGRHYCEFKADETVWVCTNWDSLAVAREKESGEGAWRPINAP